MSHAGLLLYLLDVQFRMAQRAQTVQLCHVTVSSNEHLAAVQLRAAPGWKVQPVQVSICHPIPLLIVVHLRLFSLRRVSHTHHTITGQALVCHKLGSLHQHLHLLLLHSCKDGACVMS